MRGSPSAGVFERDELSFGGRLRIGDFIGWLTVADAVGRYDPDVVLDPRGQPVQIVGDGALASWGPG